MPEFRATSARAVGQGGVDFFRRRQGAMLASSGLSAELYGMADLPGDGERRKEAAVEYPCAECERAGDLADGAAGGQRWQTNALSHHAADVAVGGIRHERRH